MTGSACNDHAAKNLAPLLGGDDDKTTSNRRPRFNETSAHSTETTVSPSSSFSSSSSSSSLVAISLPILFLSVIPLLSLTILCWQWGLFDLCHGIVQGLVRTALQLSCLAALLGPVFRYGLAYPTYVVVYCLFLITMAAYEASARTKYDFDGQFFLVLVSLALNVGGVALFTFGVVLRQGLAPCPWNPRYVIPIVGMLLGNSIGAVALSLNALTTALVEQRAEIELYLAAGATPHQAVARLWQEAILTGATPVLQMMRVTGIIAIPGMMTGQILGSNGSARSTQQAARYQMLIIYLIATCVMGVILCNAWLVTAEIGFEQQQQQHANALRTDRFVLSKRKSVFATLVWMFALVGDYASVGWWQANHALAQQDMPSKVVDDSIVVDSLVVDAEQANPLQANTSFVIRLLQQTCLQENKDSTVDGTCQASKSSSSSLSSSDTLLRIRGLTKSFPTSSDGASSFAAGPLFENVDLDVETGDLFLVNGPSGAGKSTFLKGVAGLIPMDTGTLEWTSQDGVVSDWRQDAQSWRRHVRYVPQSKVDIPGTPSDFITKIGHFDSWKDVDKSRFWEQTVDLLDKLGLASDCLDKEWSHVSGGESQRIMIAIAMASRPKVILFDEATSALDKISKLAVEDIIKSFVRNKQGAVLWISHDEEQVKRMSLN